MKITIDRELLDDALFYIGRTIGIAKTVKTTFRSVYFKFVDGDLYLYSSDGQHFCEYFYGSIGIEDCLYAVDYQLLYKIVSTSNSDNLVLDFIENALLVIDVESEYRLQYLESTDYSYLFIDCDTTLPAEAKLNMTDFQTIYPFVGVCINNPSEIIKLRGLYYDGTFVSTDSKAMAFYPYSDPIETPFFFTPATYRLFRGLSMRAEDVFLYRINSTVFMVGERFKYIVSVLGSDFPSYQLALNRKASHTYKVIVDRDVLSKKCKRLLPFIDRPNKPTILTFTQDTLTLQARSEVKGGKEAVRIQTEGINEKELSFTVNLFSLITYLARLFNETVQLTFSERFSEYAILDGVAFFIEGTLR